MHDDRTRVQPDNEDESGRCSKTGKRPMMTIDPTFGQLQQLFQQFVNDRREGRSPKIAEYLERVDLAFGSRCCAS